MYLIHNSPGNQGEQGTEIIVRAEDMKYDWEEHYDWHEVNTG